MKIYELEYRGLVKLPPKFSTKSNLKVHTKIMKYKQKIEKTNRISKLP